MKYIYYILAIVVLFSGLAAYGLFDTRIEISEQVLSVNDRIFSKSEFDRLMKRQPGDVSREGFVQSLIEKQLLIQEAIRQEINKEESFRVSVEDFYEQSLIKILLDRKLASLTVDVTQKELLQYETMLGKHLVISKMRLSGSSKYEVIKIIDQKFINLSDDLKYIVMQLKKGEVSNAQVQANLGLIAYRLDDIRSLAQPDLKNGSNFDVKQVSLFLRDKKKEQLLSKWIDSIRDSAQIWREK